MKRQWPWPAFLLFLALSRPTTAQEPSPPTGSVSPDKKWEYRCEPYANNTECRPKLVRIGTGEVAVDLQEDLVVSGSESVDARIFWAPDSKRFALNYSPIHAHHIQVETVTFYQLNGNEWVQLPALLKEGSNDTQLAELAKQHLLKGFSPANCEPGRDVIKLRSWTDNSTATVYAPCYGKNSGKLNTGFLFTLRFDDAGNWKIVKTNRLSSKELKDKE